MKIISDTAVESNPLGALLTPINGNGGNRTDVRTVASTAINTILDGGQPHAGVQPAHLGDYAEVYSEMLRAYDQGGKEAANKAFLVYAKQNPAIMALAAGGPEPQRRIWTAAELLAAEFPPPTWVIPGLLPAGKVDLAGRPKLGKSWLALQIAVAVSSGGMVFDHRVEQAPVLYLALEDNPRRLQDRLRKQQAVPTHYLHLATEWELFSRGGVADILEAINQHEHKLVVVDTISRALGGADQMDAAEMNVSMGNLQRFALERQICLLCVDHHRKSAGGGSGDPVDDILGATAKVGVSDAVLGLYRPDRQREATLKLVGRDIDDQELAITFDATIGCWQLLGTPAAVKAESVQAQILTAIQELGGQATTERIAKWLGKASSNVSTELGKLAEKGLVMRLEKQGREVVYVLAAS